MAKVTRPYGSFLKKETMLAEFQSRFVMPFAVFAGCTLLLFSAFMVLRARSLMVNQLYREQLAAAEQTASGLESAFGTASSLLVSVAKSPVTHALNPRDITPVLEGYIKHFENVSSLYLFDMHNNVLTSTDPSDARSLTMMHDPCFEKISKSAETCYSDVVQEADGNKMAYVYTPVFNNGGTLYRVLAGSVPVGRNAFKNLVLDANPGKHGFALLADRSGAVVLNGDTKTKAENMPGNLGETTAVKEALAGNKGTDKYKYGKTGMTASYVPVEGPNWALIVQRPSSEVGVGAGLVLLVIGFVLVGTLGAVAVAVLQSQTVTRFLFQLSGRLDSLVQGKLDLELAASDDNDEISRLSGSFNDMLKAYRRERKETEATLRKATETAQFNKGVVDSMSDILMVLGPNSEVRLANAAAARFCNVHETAMAGRPVDALGARWDRKQVKDAILHVIRENRAVTISGLSMPDSDDPDIELRVYPLEGKSAKKPDGVILYGVRLSPEISDLITRSRKKLGELTETQTRLERSEKYFREMIRDMNDALFILDEKGRIEWSNGAAKKLLPSDSKGFQGQVFSGLVAEAYRGVFEQNATRALGTGAFLPPAEMILEAPSGKKFVEVSFSRAASHDSKYKVVITLREVPAERLSERCAAQSVVRDASRDRERMERKIRFLTGALDAVPLAVAVTELDGRIIQVNREFGKLFKNKREVFVGKSIATLHAGDSKFLALGMTAQVGAQHLETRVQPHAGAGFVAEAWAVPLAQGPGGGKALLCGFREIGSQRAEAEREKRAVRETTLSATSRDIAKRLQSPVAGMIQSLQQLGGNLFSDENRDIWWSAMRGGMTLNQSVNMMLLYANEQPLTVAPCDMNAIVGETLETLRRHKMVPESLDIAFQPVADTPACEADAEQMKLVIWNLALNAVQAVEGRAGAEVQVNVYSRDIKGTRMMVVDVLDSGPEFNSSEIGSFFDPFYGNRQGGVGLGLTLSRRAIERHGGRIGMERKNGFTRVSFAFPLSGGASSRKPSSFSRAMN